MVEQVIFVPSCSTLQRNALLAACICVLYTPMVSIIQPSSPSSSLELFVVRLVFHTEVNFREFVFVVLAGKIEIT